jgi:hypothetical protein
LVYPVCFEAPSCQFGVFVSLFSCENVQKNVKILEKIRGDFGVDLKGEFGEILGEIMFLC